MNLSERMIDWMERGWIPDFLIRAGIRRLCTQRLREIGAGDCQARQELLQAFIQEMDGSVIAPVPKSANEQHYELPPEFFGLTLGPRRKYSSCWYPQGVSTLEGAEVAALNATCQHAEIADGMDILELGCGWGSLTLWIAEHYPASRITAVSNSAPQRQFIVAEAQRLGLKNIRVITVDMNNFDIAQRFDRVVSVEMFEHMRNYRQLLARIAAWLRPGGKLFIHIFVHRDAAYAFETQGTDNWMGRHFFTGGIMPSDELPMHFQEDMRVLRRWRWDGTHYQRTANHWLANLDAHPNEAMKILCGAYGPDDAGRWLQRWRVFFMACAELFGYGVGQEWWVSHYLFHRLPRSADTAQINQEELKTCERQPFSDASAS